ncbi:MAG: sigma-54-dependent Fis family transcriptional regulator, partial [Bacteroidetes bacterium]|nr:sigma-54-dependent Fis family transcriptional regulator [Bacteroidota bacterium]
KLLRVLQERQVERVGSHQTISLDVRLITATNQDLAKRVAEGIFREDLYYRINVFPIKIPPLRERIEDIVPLAEKFLVKYRVSMGQPEARLTDKARSTLRTYGWPGNVRELENTIQRALLLCDGTWIQPEDFALDIKETGHKQVGGDMSHPLDRATAATAPKGESGLVGPSEVQLHSENLESERASPTLSSQRLRSADVKSMEREHILHVLEQVGGNRRRAVELLGISERTLRYKLKLWREEGFEVP